MKSGRASRLTWPEDFWGEHRLSQELVLISQRDKRHTVGEMRRETPDDGPASLMLTPDDGTGSASVGRITVSDGDERRLRWICCQCWAAGRRRDDNLLRSERILEVLDLMQRQGPLGPE